MILSMPSIRYRSLESRAKLYTLRLKVGKSSRSHPSLHHKKIINSIIFVCKRCVIIVHPILVLGSLIFIYLHLIELCFVSLNFQ